MCWHQGLKCKFVAKKLVPNVNDALPFTYVSVQMHVLRIA